MMRVFYVQEEHDLKLIGKALATWRGEGTAALLDKVRRWTGSRIYHFKHGFTHNNRAAGRWVEMTGNRGRVEGLTFDLDNPCVATFLKCRFLFNTYETGARELVHAFLPPEVPVIEFGGSLGVVSCITNRKLADPERHVVVEANPGLIPTLEKNRLLNDCRFTVVHGALAYGGEQVQFFTNPKKFLGSSLVELPGTEAVQVPSVSLKSLLDRHGFDRVNLILDVEGAEADLVREELATLQARVGLMIMDTHGEEWEAGRKRLREMQKRLEQGGFRLEHRVGGDGPDVVYVNQALSP
jgi:FkbM family methyltransferase